MNNGDDSPYYLSLGFRTITIEANSELVEQAKLRFAREIASGRSIGVADRGVSFPFGFVRRTRALVRSIELTHRGGAPQNRNNVTAGVSSCFTRRIV